MLGREHECREHALAARQSVASNGAHSIEHYGAGALGLLEITLGRPEEALTHLEACRRHEEQNGVGLPTVLPSGADLVEAYVAAGAPDQARRALERLEALAARIVVPQHEDRGVSPQQRVPEARVRSRVELARRVEGLPT